MKFVKTLFILVISAAALFSCQSGGSSSSEFDPDADLDRSHMFFDDFDQGVDFNSWQISRSKWGVGNGGVLPENVHYTDDGVLVLQANGDLYDGPLRGVDNNHGRRTGAKIETRDPFGPGRYEVRMKALPRFGATTAIWTYEFVDNLNQEIDIELNVENNFKTAWFTNWVTLDDKVSKAVETDVVHNDGEWHTYKFEWHTNPMRIDYYVDDVHYQTATASVPTYASRFNIGMWFPDAWAGTPDFETDYMYVDWVKITPYLNNDYIDTTASLPASPSSYYPTTPIDYPTPNLISNPGFEGMDSAWRRATLSNVEIAEGLGHNGSKGIKIPANDIAYQFITGLDESFELTLRSRVKHGHANAQVLMEFYPLETTKIGETSMSITDQDEGYVPSDFYIREMTLTLPAGTRRIELSLFSLSGDLYMDDLFLNLKAKTPPLATYAEGDSQSSPHDFYDGFTNGLSADEWQVGNQAWGTNNGGVIPSNVNYLENGTLVLTANGDHYEGSKLGINAENGKRTGAAIISRRGFGPGSFSVRAKAMPRFGATTAFWTYYHIGNANHEIDIELNVNNDFKRAWFTNWLTDEDAESKKMDTDVLHNDGEFHNYRFDWHTGENPRIEYYLDDVLMHTSTGHIPTSAMRMWIGVWFPNGWAGNPDFETDHLFVDSFTYTSFPGEPYTPIASSEASPAGYYPQSPMAYQASNWISQNANPNGSAWSKSGNVIAQDGAIVNQGGTLSQTISGVREGMDVVFSASLSNGAEVSIEFLDAESNRISLRSIQTNSDRITLYPGTRFLKVSLNATGTYRGVFLNVASRV